jgi:DNA invertase Pin-like site-specific DNA recombinase
MSNVKKTVQTEWSKLSPIQRFLSRKNIEEPTIYDLLDDGPWSHTRPSDYIEWLDDAKSKRVVIWSRVSDRSQNVRPQRSDIKRACKSHGVDVIKCVRHVGNGNIWSILKKDSKFRRAVKLARKHDADILAMSTSRVIRHTDREAVRRDRHPDIMDFMRLKKLLRGVRVITVLHPDEKPEVVKAMEVERGLREVEAEGQKLGRPPKVEEKISTYQFRNRRRKSNENLDKLIKRMLADGVERSWKEWHAEILEAGFEKGQRAIERRVSKLRK